MAGRSGRKVGCRTGHGRTAGRHRRSQLALQAWMCGCAPARGASPSSRLATVRGHLGSPAKAA